MLVTKLVQNYYELHGDFNGILVSDFGNMINPGDDALIEYCYKCLGYKSIGNLPASVVHDLRLAYVTGDLEKINSIFHGATLEDVKYFLESNNFLPSVIDSPMFKINVKYAEYSKMLALHLKNNSTIYIDFMNYHVAIKDAISALKLQPRSITKNAKSMVEQLLEEISFVTADGKPFIYKNEFHLPIKISEAGKKALITDAIIQATGADVGVPKAILKAPADLLLLSFENNALYLAMLEHAESVGMSYADMLSHISISTPDYGVVWRELGCLVMICGDVCYAIRLDDEGQSILLDLKEGDLTGEA